MLTVMAAALGAPAASFAHEGHDHKLLGVLTKVGAQQIEVRDKDGKLSTILVKAETRIVRGTTKLTLADLKVDQRVVVNIGAAKEPLTAKDIQVGLAAATAK
jgi:hypothetical protein